jgi:glycosyltransferase involved in cell wall biosynthesis
LNQKIQSVLSGETLRICYVGRAAEMKGPLDWLQVIYKLYQNGINLEATWLGDGPLLQEMNSFVNQMGLEQQVKLLGFVENREQIFQTMKNHHLLMFCHKTPESPRCLVESLVCGTPIVGYGSHYSQGLISKYGGGAFVPMNEWEKLADKIIELNMNRTKLGSLIQEAAKSGTIYDEENVFKHRSYLIKKYCTNNVTTNKNLLIHSDRGMEYGLKSLYSTSYKQNSLRNIKVNSALFPKEK